METKKETGILYRSFYEGVQELPADLKLEAYDAYCEMVLDGKDYAGDNLAIRVLLRSLKGKAEDNREKWEETCKKRSDAGRKGGLKRAENMKKKAAEKSKPKEEPIPPQDHAQEIEEAIQYLNRAARVYYVPKPDTSKLIYDRLEEGFTLAQLKQVIDRKVKDWTGTKFQNRLRPETLFGEHFQSYLNEKDIEENPKNRSFSSDGPVQAAEASDEDVERILSAMKENKQGETA